MKRTICGLMGALLLAGTVPVSALAVGEDDTAGYMEELLQSVEPMDGTEPMPIIPNPFAEDNTDALCTVKVNGEQTDIQAVIAVPLKAVAEKLGFQVIWNGMDKPLTIDNGIVHSEITIGEDCYTVTTSQEDTAGMSAPFSLQMAPYIVNGTTYVPVALFDALLGCEDAVRVEQGLVVIEPQKVQLADPFVPCENLEQAARLTGFTLELSHTPETVSVLDNTMIEANMENGICVRKAAGSEDISGDYNRYPESRTVNGVTLKGTGNAVSLAIWNTQGYTYSVSVREPVSQAQMLELIANIH